LVTSIIEQHPNPEVASLWAKMAADTCQRFAGPPQPSQANLSLPGLEGLDKSTQQAVVDAVESYLQGYFVDVNNQLLGVHKELLTLQKQVAESAVGYSAEGEL